MKVAFFTPYLPYPPDTGGKIRSYYLLRALSAYFCVDLYTVYIGQAPPETAVRSLEECCNQVVLFPLKKSWRTRDRLRRTLSPLPRIVDYFCTSASLEQAYEHLSRGGYDLLVADEICMTPYVEMIPDRPRIIFRHKVDYLHYREVARARPWGADKILEFMESVKLQRYERAKMGLYQGYVACSEGDAAQIRQYALGIPYIVIPNGVDLSAFVPSGRPKASQPTLLYVGSMYYPPNVDAVQFFFQSICPSIWEARPEVRVQIVGHMPPPEVQQWARWPGVEVTGGVPDVRPYYEEATVFIVPLRLGGGTRLKIPEAMAMGLPVVSTSVGAEGLDIHPGEDILIADDPTSFAKSVLQLLSDPELRERIAAGGRRLARQYDWKELTRPLPEWVISVVDNWRWRRSNAHCTAR